MLAIIWNERGEKRLFSVLNKDDVHQLVQYIHLEHALCVMVAEKVSDFSRPQVLTWLQNVGPKQSATFLRMLAPYKVLRERTVSAIPESQPFVLMDITKHHYFSFEIL